MKNGNHWARLLAYVTGLINQELLLQNEYLAALHRIAADAVEDQNEETKQKIKDEIDAAPMSAEREEQEKKQQMQQFQASFQKMTDKANLKGEGAALAA